MQIAIGTDDVYKTAEAIKLCGGKITREPGPLPGINTKITACLDPDGWKTVFSFAREVYLCLQFFQAFVSDFWIFISPSIEQIFLVLQVVVSDIV